jgi:hypothetical protein
MALVPCQMDSAYSFCRYTYYLLGADVKQGRLAKQDAACFGLTQIGSLHTTLAIHGNLNDLIMLSYL